MTGRNLNVDSQFELVQRDFSHTPSDEAERAAKDVIDAVLGTPFDLVNGPLVRAQVIKVADDLYYFHWTAHHIVYDGWSAVIVIDEIRTIYNRLVEDGNSADWQALLDEPDSFREYVEWETAARASEEGAEALQYWRDRFAELPTPLQLPTDRPRPLRKTYSGTSLHFEFDADVIAGVRAAAKREKQSLFMVLLAAYKALLYKLTDQTDIVVGIPMAGQAMAGMDNLLGHCVNIVPIRSKFEKTATFSSLLPTLRNDFLDAQEYQPLTFGTILRELNVPRDASRSPLVEVVFNLDRHMPPEEFVGLDVEIREVPKQAINWEMFLNLYEEGDTLKADFDYNCDLYDAATVRRWLEHLQEILRSIADADTAQQTPLNRLNALSAVEKKQILVEWNATQQPHPTDVTIHGLIEAQVAKTPTATAWIYEGDSLSYDGLNKRANRIAHYLMARGVGANSRVGLFLNRGIDMGVAVLGVLKTGATYVPLAPDYPAERVKFIMEDSDAAVLDHGECTAA